MDFHQYKKIPAQKLTLALDRLTRFKPTGEKYKRVFKDLVDKYTDVCTKNLSAKELSEVGAKIFNLSVCEDEDNSLNDPLDKLLKNDERASFFQDDESEAFLSVKLNVQDALEFIGDEPPKNLRRLVVQNKFKNKDPKALRREHSLLYPIEKVVLCEGATEEILLEKIAKHLGYDFDKEGVYLIGAGGKNQVARKYYKIINEIKLPVFILLDLDAIETEKLILSKLRSTDSIYVIKSGEFEDILPKNLILKAINSHFKNNLQCMPEDFSEHLPMSKNLREIFRIKGFGDFKKSEFAKIVKSHIEHTDKKEFEGELLKITELIKAL